LFGATSIDERNGYLHGKRWLDITVAMWKEDLWAGRLWRTELTGYEVAKLPSRAIGDT
jgi:hypothetical protein